MDLSKIQIVNPGVVNEHYYVILIDFMYWADREEELKKWCNKNLRLGEHSFAGAVIECQTEKELVLFLLRWS